jgi:hypothetical protein
MAVTFVMMLAGVAFAAEPAAAPDTPAVAEATGGIGKAILAGVVGGILASIAGWLKNRQNDKQEPFDLKYMISTVLVGAIAGAVAGWQGLATPGDAIAFLEQTPYYGAAVMAIEVVWKAIFRQVAPRIRDAIAAVKAGSGTNPPKPS